MRMLDRLPLRCTRPSSEPVSDYNWEVSFAGCAAPLVCCVVRWEEQCQVLLVNVALAAKQVTRQRRGRRPSLDRPLEPRAFVRMDSLEERGPRRNSIEERAPHLVRDAAALTTALMESVGVGHASHSIHFNFGRATLHLAATVLQIQDRLDSTLPRLGVPSSFARLAAICGDGAIVRGGLDRGKLGTHAAGMAHSKTELPVNDDDVRVALVRRPRGEEIDWVSPDWSAVSASVDSNSDGVQPLPGSGGRRRSRCSVWDGVRCCFMGVPEAFCEGVGSVMKDVWGKPASSVVVRQVQKLITYCGGGKSILLLCVHGEHLGTGTVGCDLQQTADHIERVRYVAVATTHRHPVATACDEQLCPSVAEAMNQFFMGRALMLSKRLDVNRSRRGVSVLHAVDAAVALNEAGRCCWLDGADDDALDVDGPLSLVVIEGMSVPDLSIAIRRDLSERHLLADAQKKLDQATASGVSAWPL